MTTPDQAAKLHRDVAGVTSMTGRSQEEMMKSVLDRLIFLNEEMDRREHLYIVEDLLADAHQLLLVVEHEGMKI